MRTSCFVNILATFELYASNQIEGTHFSFVIHNFNNVSGFSTLIFSQKTSPIVKALNIDFHGKFQDRFYLCNVNIYFF